MAINSTLPDYLAQRTHWTNESVSRGIQQGAQLYQQSQQEQRMQWAAALQEEAKRYALEEKERIAEGAVAVTRVLAKMGRSGGYADPALQAELYDEIGNHPKFANSPAFKDVMDTLQHSEQAKARAEMLRNTYDLRGGELEQKHLLKLDEIDAQLEKALSVEGLKQEDRVNLEGIRHKNNLERDQLRPRTLRPDRFVLDRDDEMSMAADLKKLEIWYRDQLSRTFDKTKRAAIEIEYTRQKEGVEAKYAPRRKVPASQPPAATQPPVPTQKRVRVVKPDGKIGTLPENQIEEALKQGYQLSP